MTDMTVSKITYDEATDDMTCSCGNRSHLDGFVPVDEAAYQECEPDQFWEGRYMCMNCSATIVIPEVIQ